VNFDETNSRNNKSFLEVSFGISHEYLDDRLSE
jgi:hypothetical protein